MIILGLDQATTKSGFCVMDVVDGKIIKYGFLNLTDIKSHPCSFEEKITNVKEFLERAIKFYNVDIVVIEGVQAQSNPKTYAMLSGLQCVLRQYLYQNYIPYAILSPSQWRKVIGIKGRDRKTQKANAQEYIYQKIGENVTEDEADAICLSLAAIEKIKDNSLEIIRDIT